MKVTIKGFIYKSKILDEFYYQPSQTLMSDSFVLVGPCSFEYELPTDFNHIAAQVEAIDAQIQKANEEIFAIVNELNLKKAALLCPANTVTQ